LLAERSDILRHGLLQILSNIDRNLIKRFRKLGRIFAACLSHIRSAATSAADHRGNAFNQVASFDTAAIRSGVTAAISMGFSWLTVPKTTTPEGYCWRN